MEIYNLRHYKIIFVQFFNIIMYPIYKALEAIV
jgi:hypothetical protein